MKLSPITLSKPSAPTSGADLGELRPLFKPAGEDPQDWALLIDNSRSELGQACPVKSLFGMVLQRIPAGTSPALTFGSAIHKGLEVFYARDGADTKEQVYEAVAKEVEKEYAKAGESLFNEWRTLDRAIYTLERYTNEYWDEPVEVYRKQDGGFAIEMPFSIPIGVIDVYRKVQVPPNIRSAVYLDRLFGEHLPRYYFGEKKIRTIQVFWTGRIDLCAKVDGEPWVIDHKTTSILGETYWKMFALSQAAVGYVWAARQSTRLPFSGLCANVIVGRKPTKTGVSLAFERRFFPYPAHRLEEFVPNALSMTRNFVDQIVSGDFPRYTGQCISKYGVCPYHSVCEATPASREMILFSNQYKDQRWSPLND